MVNLSIKAIESFKEIYLEEFHVELSEDEAQSIASDFLKCFSMIYRPLENGGENGEKQNTLTHDNKIME